MVEYHVANVKVAGPNPVSRSHSILGQIPREYLKVMAVSKDIAFLLYASLKHS